jgi:hypothetical protein
MKEKFATKDSTYSINFSFTDFVANPENKENTYSADYVIDAYLDGVEAGKKARFNELKSYFKKNTEISLKQIGMFDNLLKKNFEVETIHLYVKILSLDLFEAIFISKGEIPFKKKLQIATLKKLFNRFLTDLSSVRINISVFENEETLNLTLLNDDGYSKLK